TSKIRLVTSVIVIPHRNPLFMAKALATVDVLSGGRVTVGCGAGWMAEEFAALNLPPFEARGRVTDEYIQAMKVAWTEPNPSFDGEFVKFDHIDMNPRPLQHPHPPIWIGGESMPAIRRTAAIGDAWYPFGSNPKFRMDKIETFTARLAKLHQHAEKIGRDPASIELAYNCAFHDSKEAQHVDGGRQSFTGSAQQRADDIGQFAAAGVSNIVVNVGAGDLNAMLDRMEEFASNVMPLVD
ncbi:MAG: putative F420-dependent oxidoreductase, partial [Gammaproteobacteria bacterium]